MKCATLLCALVVSAASAAEPSGAWTMPAGDYARTRYSALGEIDKDIIALAGLGVTALFALMVVWQTIAGVVRVPPCMP